MKPPTSQFPWPFGGSSRIDPVGEQWPCCPLGLSGDTNETQEEPARCVCSFVCFSSHVSALAGGQ